MTSIDQQIRSHINSFVVELQEMVRQAAVASVTEAFGRPSTRIRSQNGSATQAAQPRSRTGVRRKGAKRDPNDLAALTEKLGEYISKTPGRRIEDIAKALGTTTKELQLPARKLIAARRVFTKGVKRSTTYYAR